MIDRLLFHIFEVIFETIIELIPQKIRKVIGIILIIIGSIFTLLIAILYLVEGPAAVSYTHLTLPTKRIV